MQTALQTTPPASVSFDRPPDGFFEAFKMLQDSFQAAPPTAPAVPLQMTPWQPAAPRIIQVSAPWQLLPCGPAPVPISFPSASAPMIYRPSWGTGVIPMASPPPIGPHVDSLPYVPNLNLGSLRESLHGPAPLPLPPLPPSVMLPETKQDGAGAKTATGDNAGHGDFYNLRVKSPGYDPRDEEYDPFAPGYYASGESAEYWRETYGFHAETKNGTSSPTRLPSGQGKSPTVTDQSRGSRINMDWWGSECTEVYQLHGSVENLFVSALDGDD